MNNLRKIALPVAILILGAGSAYATSVVKNNKVVENAFRFDPLAPVQKCIMVQEKQCQAEILGEICTWFDGTTTHNLYEGPEGTSCGNTLYEIPN